MQQSIETSTELLGLSFPGVRFDETGLELPPNLPFNEWLRIGDTLNKLDAALPWARGYWLEYAKQHYDDRYTQILEATDYKGKQSLYNLAHVYRQFPNVNSRYEGLTFSHHQELCNIPDEYRPALAERAVAEGLSTYELRQQIEHEKSVLGMVEVPFDVETPQEFYERWILQAVRDIDLENCLPWEGAQDLLDLLTNPTYEGSERVLAIIISRRKQALGKGKG